MVINFILLMFNNIKKIKFILKLIGIKVLVYDSILEKK